jgi:LysM repeat protein
LADAPEVQASFKLYIVKRGETLPLIARKLHVSRNDLADANYLSATARVDAGQQLMVPYEATALMAAQSDRPVPATEARRTVPPTGTLAEASSANRVKVIYQVKQGDTLASIARVFKTSVATIRTWNPRLDADRLLAGQRLTVYRPAT